MVRTYRRKSTYSKYDKDHILKAVKAIKVHSKSLTKVAHEYGIKVSSLYYHLNRYKDYDFSRDNDVKALKNYNQVFTEELENKFVEEFVDATDYCLGLGPMNIRKFAYEFAMHHEVDLRRTWTENEAAGEDWLNAFLKRHPSIVDISSYNAHSIQMYFKNYEDLLEKYEFRDSQIFKADEIAFTTANQPNRVFTRRGKKEESELQFLGQDELTTMISTISANGSALIPMFIIPRTGFVSDMIEKALEGSIKVSNKSRWMTKSDFLEYLAHFVKVTQCSKTAPCLLMLDNHACSLTLESIAYAKNNGVFLLILPLHTYNKLHPLKDKVFSKLRFKVSSACKKWVATNKKKPMKIKDILEVVETVFPKVFTSNDIKMGFESSNIYPVNSSNFSDENISVPKDVIPLNDNDDVTNDTDPLAIDTDNIEKDADPVEKDTNSVEKDIDSVEEDTDPVEKDAGPVKKDTDSVEKDTDPVEKDSDPVEKDTDSVEKDTDLVVKGSDFVEKNTVEKDTDPIEKDSDSVEKDTNFVEKDNDPVEKEELETADEVVVIYSPKDSNSSKKIPLAQIEQILGITLTLEKKDSDMTSTEQKENIEDHTVMNDGEEKGDSKQLNQDEDVINEKVSNTPKKNKLDKSNKSETDKKKRRKPNSKLSDYVCY